MIRWSPYKRTKRRIAQMHVQHNASPRTISDQLLEAIVVAAYLQEVRR